MSLEHCSRFSLLTEFVAGSLELGKKCGLGCFKNITLSAMLCLIVLNFQAVVYN